MMVASTTVPSRSRSPCSLKCSPTPSKIFSPNGCFSKMAECQDGAGIRNVVCDQINSGKAADAGTINQLILHSLSLREYQFCIR